MKVISVEHLSKAYQLGQIGTGTLTNDLKVWWARQRGKPNPLLRIGETDHGNREGETLWALKDVSFTVEQGEALGIIGRNGSGKSTLLKVLSRITAPTSGKVRVKGRIASLLEVGTGFHPELTGRENIYLNGAILGMTRREIDRKFDEIVDFAEIEQFIDTPVKRYSSGMYVRLAFAVAAHLDPEILVVDEVLAVGDAEFQKKCLGKMGDVAKEGRTVLFVSHNMAAIEALCGRVLLVDKGAISEVGGPTEVIDKYIVGLSAVFGESERYLSGKYLRKISLLNSAGHQSRVFSPGEDIRVLVSVDTGMETVRHPQLGLGISTRQGQRVCTVASYFARDRLPPISGKQIIQCTIERPNLAPGDYLVKVAFGSGGVDIDAMPDCISMTVRPMDYFGNGRLPTYQQGVVMIGSVWQVLD